MNKILKLIILAGLSISVANGGILDLRIWTKKSDGKTLIAKIINKTDTIVSVKTTGNKIHKLPLSILSDKDLKFIEEYDEFKKQEGEKVANLIEELKITLKYVRYSKGGNGLPPWWSLRVSVNPLCFNNKELLLKRIKSEFNWGTDKCKYSYIYVYSSSLVCRANGDTGKFYGMSDCSTRSEIKHRVNLFKKLRAMRYKSLSLEKNQKGELSERWWQSYK